MNWAVFFLTWKMRLSTLYIRLEGYSAYFHSSSVNGSLLWTIQLWTWTNDKDPVGIILTWHLLVGMSYWNLVAEVRHIEDNCCSKMAWEEEWPGKERSARRRGGRGVHSDLKGLVGSGGIRYLVWSKRRNRRPETKFYENNICHDDSHKVTISLFLKYFLGMEYSIYSQILKQNSLH